MNSSEYTVTMPYREFKKWQEIEQTLKELKTNFNNCFDVDEEKETVDVDYQKLVDLFKSISPERYQEYNYALRS
jgi:hypothetical protein